MTDRPELHLVPGGDDGHDGEPAPDPERDTTAPAEVDATPDGTVPTDVEGRDPLLVRAERIADLPLPERPSAFDGLNRAVVDELNHLDEG